MQYVVTLTANKSLAPLTSHHAMLTENLLQSLGSQSCETRWLSLGTAVDIVFDKVPLSVAREKITTRLDSVPVDVNVQELKGRRKRILIADMDSTIIENESLDDLADIAGLKSQVEVITEKAMRGEMDFKIALKERVRLLKGQPETILQRFLLEKIKITDGAFCLIKTMKTQGAITALVSGGFSQITEHVANKIGFDINLGNQLLINDKIITGEISAPILNAQSKKRALYSISNNQNKNIDETMAVGDGANDIPMLQSAGVGVAFRAKPIVDAAAEFRVNHCDLTALLYIQGYHDKEINK
tara:strand:+ start:173 stop:1072 length:900 start_codon:yes stop_codon:yes gene_type:complete